MDEMEALRRSFEWGASLCALRKYPYVQLEPAHRDAGWFFL